MAENKDSKDIKDAADYDASSIKMLKGLEAVRNAFRKVQGVAILRAKLDCRPFSESRRLRPQVESDIVDRTADAAHQLGLGMGRFLVVHAAQRAAPQAVGQAGLRDARIQPAGMEFFGAEAAREEPARIRNRLESRQEYSRKRRAFEPHALKPFFDLTTYWGLPLMSTKARPRYSPITPKASSWTPPMTSIVTIRDDQPGTGTLS